MDNPRNASIYNTVEKPALQEGMDQGRVTDLREFDIDDYHDRIRR